MPLRFVNLHQPTYSKQDTILADICFLPPTVQNHVHLGVTGFDHHPCLLSEMVRFFYRSVIMSQEI
jgi:hypothetical protein